MRSPKPTGALLACALVLLAITGGATPAAPVSAAVPLVDDFEAGLPAGQDANGIAIGFLTFQDPNSSVAISTTAAPPAQPPGAAATNHVIQLDVNVASFAGFTHGFENAGVNQWVSQDWSAYEGLSFWLYGAGSGIDLFVDVLDNRNPGATTDDAERWSVAFKDDISGWRRVELPFASMARKNIGNGAPNDGFGLTEVHGWAFGTLDTGGAKIFYIDDAALYGVAPVRPLTVGFSAIRFPVAEGGAATITARLSKPSADPVTVQYATTIGQAIANRDYTPTSGTLTFPPNITQQSFTVQTRDDGKYQGERGVQVELRSPTGGAALGTPPVARVAITDNEAFDPTLLDDFETFPYLWSGDSKATLANPEIAAGSPLALPGQGAYERVLEAGRRNGQGAYEFGRTFPMPQDWSDASGMSFWYYGQGSGRDVEVRLTNRRQPERDARPSSWKLAWSDEFNGAAGAPPNPSVWGREVGDGVAIGNPGWGNDELQFYTDSSDNASTDGRGNLAITAKAADGVQQCYYGPCKYTSARLLTKQRFELAYGRVEARIKVPRGAGLWPAFWMLGSDIDQVPWPQTGEIDIMENVGRLPNEVFGTLHGPGYSGGQSYGDTYDFGRPMADSYHTYAVEWQPDKIAWFVDGIQYHQATPSDPFMQGKQWVYNHPFFMLLNVAVGGNFGGAVGPDTTFPQQMLVDYVRLYQAKPRPITFEASFRDSFTGWQQVTLPFAAFANKDGLPLDRSGVASVEFRVPSGLKNPVRLDQLRLPCASDVTVGSAADSGAGSLRRAIGSVCAGGTVRFASSLAGQTITLTSGPLTLAKNVSIDGSAAAGLVVSGGGAHRVFVVNAGATATVSHLTIANGYGFQLAGGILNNGSLTLDHATVAGNSMTTNAGDFWQGGGGIYNGQGATLQLVDSTVSGNTAGWSGGGIYSFFDTTTTILRSTISGNVSNDVGGAIRSLGDVTITNSTISGNRSTGWHGGAIFHTDGAMAIASSTIASNVAPDFAPSAIFIGQFSPGIVPSLTLTNSIIAGNQWYACERFASGNPVAVTSGGHNVVQDASCNAAASDQVVGDAGIGPLASNGGPTQTHALLAGSPALNAADPATSPPTDQRGVARPQGAGPDSGAYEAP
jgi:beta-glucanase (GH16 family)